MIMNYLVARTTLALILPALGMAAMTPHHRPVLMAPTCSQTPSTMCWTETLSLVLLTTSLQLKHGHVSNYQPVNGNIKEIKIDYFHSWHNLY